MRHQIARVAEARETPNLGDQGDGDYHRHAAQRLQGRHHRHHRPFRDQFADPLGQGVPPLLGVLRRIHVVLEHDPLRRMVKAQGRQPVPIRPRPGLAGVDEAVPQQKAEQLLSCPAETAHRDQPCLDQVAQRVLT